MSKKISPHLAKVMKINKKEFFKKEKHPCGTSKSSIRDVDGNIEKIRGAMYTLTQSVCTCDSPAGSPHKLGCPAFRPASAEEVLLSQRTALENQIKNLTKWALKWSTKTPIVEGTYLFVDDTCSPKLCYTHQGKWQNTENPELMYVSYYHGGMKMALVDIQLDRKPMWFGPIDMHPVFEDVLKSEHIADA